MRTLFPLKRAAVVAALACLSLPASASSYSFLQTGFSGGGTLSGTFSGAAGADNVLTLDELTAFSLSFSGDSFIADFSLAKSDMLQFVYRDGSGVLGDDPIEGLLDVNTRLISGLGPAGFAGTELIGNGDEYSLSLNPLTVTAVPEPSTAVFLLAGLALVGHRLRRRQA